MTTVKVTAGACRFITRIKATRGEKRTVRIEMESGCESVEILAFVLGRMEPFGITDVISTNPAKNKVLQSAGENLPHSACPVPVAIIKAAEVALGLNVPSSVTIVFEREPEEESCPQGLEADEE